MNIPFDAYWALSKTYLKPQWPRVALLALLLLTNIGLQLVNPQIIRTFIDAAREGAALQRLTQAALIYLGVALLGQSLSFVALYVSQNVAWTATNALRRDLALHTLRLDMSFHKTHTPGELIERIDGDVTALANFFSQMGIHLLSNGLLALGILIALALEDGRVGLVAVGYALLTATALRAVQQASTRAWADSRQAESDLFGFFGERLAATEDLRANGAVPYVMAPALWPDAHHHPALAPRQDGAGPQPRRRGRGLSPDPTRHPGPRRVAARARRDEHRHGLPLDALPGAAALSPDATSGRTWTTCSARAPASSASRPSWPPSRAWWKGHAPWPTPCRLPPARCASPLTSVCFRYDDGLDRGRARTRAARHQL